MRSKILFVSVFFILFLLISLIAVFYWKNPSIQTKVIDNKILENLRLNNLVELGNNQKSNIVIINAEHLDKNRNFIKNIYDYVNQTDNITYTIPKNEYVRAYFERNLTNENVIDIVVNNKKPATIEVYEKDSDVVIGKIENVLEGKYYIYLNHSGSQDVFDLKSIEDVNYDYIHDPAAKITWVITTPSAPTAGDSFTIQIDGSCANAACAGNLSILHDVQGGQCNAATAMLTSCGSTIRQDSWTKLSGTCGFTQLSATKMNFSCASGGTISVTANVYACPNSQATYEIATSTVGVGVTEDCNNDLVINAADTTAPNVTVVYPVNGTTYIQSSINFNLTVTDSSPPIKCLYSLNSGVTNYTMSNTTASAFNATNTSIANGNYLARFYCNDSKNNLNNSETVNFTIASYGILNSSLSLPTDNQQVSQNNSFTINSTIRCDGSAGAVCGSVYAYARYNSSSATPNTFISQTSGASPFYILSPAGGGTGNYSYDGWNFSTSPSTDPRDVYFNGTYFWTVDRTGAEVYRYNASGNYSADSWHFDTSGQETAPEGLYFNGSNFFVVGTGSDTVYKYDSAGAYTGTSFSVASQDATPESIYFNGTYFWVVGSTSDRVYRYTSAGVYDNWNFSVASEDGEPTGLTFNGIYFWVSGKTDYIYQYNASGNYTGNKINLTSEQTQTTGVYFNGTYFWTTDSSTARVSRYSETIATANPQTSPQTLKQGESWNVTWIINATGPAGFYEIDVFFNSSYGSSNVANNDTADSTLQITTAAGDTTYPTFNSFISDPTNASNYVFGQTYRFNSTIINTNGTAGLQFNGTNYTATNSSNNFTASVTGLSAGTYSYYWWGYGNGTSKNFNSTSLMYYTVAKATPTLTFLANGGTSNLSLIYPQQVNISATNSSGKLGLDKDNVNYLTSNAANVTLSAGSYIFRANITGNQNYSDVGYSYYNVTINKTIPQGSLTNTTAWTVTYSTQTNISYSESNSGDSDVAYNISRDNVYKNGGENVTLGVNIYNYVLNTTGGANYTANASMDAKTLTVQINSTYTLTLGILPSTTETYPTQINATGTNCPGELTCNLYNNQTGELTNGANYTLGAGAYNITYNTTGNTNYSANSVSQIITVNQAIPQGTLNNKTSLTLEYPNPFNFTINETNIGDGDLTYSVYRNNIDVTSEAGTNVILGVGTWNYLLNTTGGANWTSNSSMSNFTVTITQNNTYGLSLAITPSSTVTYPTSTTATGSGCPSQITCNLSRNDTGIINNPDTTVLGVGIYNYTYNTTGNTNYSAKSVSDILTVTQNTSSVIYTYLNNSRANITIYNNTAILLNATLFNVSGTISLYNNGTLINSGVSPLSNLTAFNNTGLYNITGIYTGNTNYSGSSETWWVNVTALTDTCTCAGLNNNWEIDLADYCIIDTSCNLGTGTLNFTGAGNVTCNSNINTTNLGDVGANGIMYVNSGCYILIK